MTHDEPRVFISYRRDDAGGHAGRLFDHLIAQLGRDHVFMDVEAIAPGADFIQEIERAIEDCDALIAVIGPRWLTPGADGVARLHDPDDFVHLELVAAITAGVPVLPTLVDGASMPSIDELPGSIASLTRRNAVVLDNTRWNHDVERLMAAIKPEMTGATCPSCGRDNPAGFAFCGFCSAPIEPAARAPEERKVVSVVSWSFSGAGRGDPESARSRLITYRAQAAAVIEHFGGTLQPGSGEEVICIFGAPNTHEDDSERAIRAGLKIVETFGEFSDGGSDDTPPIPTIAVDCGDVLAGVDSGGDLVVTGEIVDSVPLLRSEAPPGSVVVGEAAHHATAGVFDWGSLEPIRPEDGAPLARWRAIEAVARLGMETDRDDATSFVGRADELDLLRRIFSRAARDREPQLVMIMGEPGAGKSRLVREFAGWLDGLTESVIWRQGRCLPYGDGITFWAIAEIVKAHAGILETDPADAVRAKLDASVEQAIDTEDRRWVASQLGPLVGSGSDGGPLEQGEVFTAWRRFFEGISDSGPLVVVLEDLHWADPALLAFIEHLVDDSIDAPIMVLGTARPELREQHAAFGGDLRSLAWVPLPALTDTETSQLVSDILGTSVVPVDVQEALLSRAAGNPLFAEQFASLLLERGVLARKGRGFVLAEGVDIPVPDNVTAIIAARLDTLAPERKRLLLDAAVVGKVFWTSVLEQLTRRPREAISQDLRELSHRGLIRRARRSSVGSDEESSFGHALTRDTAYAQIPRSELGNKHLAVADWLEHLSGERKADQADLLAYHLAEAYELSARPEALRGRMQQALVDAGRHLQRFDLVAAASRFERALEVTPDEDPARLTLMTELGRCLASSGDAIRGIEMMQDVRTAAEATGRRDVCARIGIHLARMWLFNGEAERSREELREATGSLSHIPSHRERAELWASAAMVRSHDGDSSTALAWADIAMEQLGNDDEPFTKAVILEVRGGALADMGDERGNADGREAVEILREAGAVVERGRAISELAFSLLATEGPTAAIPVMVEGLDVCARAGVSSAEANLRENIGNAMIDAGRWDEALEHIEWQYRNAERTGLARVRIGADVDTLGMTLARGEPLPASPEELVEEAGKFQDPLVPTFSDRIAGSLLAKGDIAGARRVLSLAAERVGDFALAVRTIRLPDYLRVCHALGDAELASAFVRGLELPSAPRMHASITTGRATLAEIDDRSDDAVTGYLEAIPLWDAAGCVVESAHAHAGLGRALLAMGRGTDGRQHLLQARETFASLEATRWTAWVDGWLGDAMQASS